MNLYTHIYQIKFLAPTIQALYVNSFCSGAWASFDYECGRVGYRKLVVETRRRSGHLYDSVDVPDANWSC